MKKLTLAALALLLAGCVGGFRNGGNSPGYQLNSEHPSASQNERVRFLVLHYTAADDAESLRLLTQGGVSAHYLVPSAADPLMKQRTVYQLVPEDKRAWHAGVSNWNGCSNLNDSAIGIEIVHPGFIDNSSGRHWYPWDAQQVRLVASLAQDVIQRYAITPDNVVAHSDIAPGRKFDPGPLFPWQQLAEQGIGAWPDSSTVQRYLAGRSHYAAGSVRKIQTDLASYGYTIPQTGINDEKTRKAIAAFQMHFRPTNFSGVADAETEAIAAALVAKYRTASRTLLQESDAAL
ncbi:N-acetylmuramoyl-L-alanine amidase [Erwinia pyrifoliae]|uniref:N-acetylmuramoyl-L-alanine amidase n=1 Tax=Erwinia pyrifoliae TaxID=79967 RepID=A0ABY5XCD0_ERWPY|nr:N-acetylmuramoyl-L-alanine amidase [Erwinia pyrifoliae]AUX72777.1 N-acetylmuramoyl-L-alanine amidase [Erwinia pyrifoliae]MCA8876960.1 N-acetylmuramoyl-L-alanine amidase [Erwinia pyrifoliae]MCT2387112.1 N-acetylmuramoyl-L-alanine amidase [Erwinia pyrifoliae]MCU8587289.1 N-acetylmuramoyl-L-alanine amidase [Erwinia pyrifoliae]UWS31147.1 N-acetylmuramoyl-L-alanine amidase [Erwinia pyrifoliae]